MASMESRAFPWTTLLAQSLNSPTTRLCASGSSRRKQSGPWPSSPMLDFKGLARRDDPWATVTAAEVTPSWGCCAG